MFSDSIVSDKHTGEIETTIMNSTIYGIHNIVKITIMSNNLSKNLCYTIALSHISVSP